MKQVKIEELPSGSFRVRKTYKKVVYTIIFDHRPSQKEVALAISEKLEDESAGKKGTFEIFGNEYIESRTNVCSPATIRTYRIKMNQLSDEFKTTNLYDITSITVQKEINRFAENHEPKTTKSLYGFVSSVLSVYRPNLRMKVALPQAIEKQEYDPTNEDIQRILDDAQGSRYEVPFELGVLGCRRGEICALSIDDLDGYNLHIHRDMVYDEHNKWIIKETPKTDDSNRVLPLPPSLAEKIQKQGLVFDGHPNALNKAVHRSQKRLGIPAFKFHKLRSYFASYAHSMGVPEQDILSLGGWSTPSVMKRIYRKSLESSKQKSIEKIQQGLFKK